MSDNAPRAPLVLADDLSGAAETAVALLSSTARVRILLGGTGPLPTDLGAAVPVVDLDSRALAPAAAEAAARAVVALAAPGTPVYSKIDSLLRGNVAAAVAALSPALSTTLSTTRSTARSTAPTAPPTTAPAGSASARPAPPPVVAPALPVDGRIVRGGVLHVDGVPLHLSTAWHAETAAPPESVAAALAPLPTVVLDLDTVRGPQLVDALRATAGAGAVPVCDSETDADLDAVVAAALTVPGVRLAGSGGLAAALGRRWRDGADPPALPPTPIRRPLLVVVGTAAPGAVDQVRRLVAAGATHVALPADVLAAGAAGTLLAPPGPGVTVVTVRSPHDTRPSAEGAVAAGLARAVVSALAAAPGLVDLALTGGETARRVLDALGVTELEPLGQVHHGAVVCRAPDERRVVTRPGSFGDADSLAAIARALQAVPPDPAPERTRSAPTRKVHP